MSDGPMLITPQRFITEELFNPRPNGPLLWRLRFGSSVLDAHLCDVGCWGTAYRLYLNGRFTYSERFENEFGARHAAAAILALRLKDGWLMEASNRHTAEASQYPAVGTTFLGELDYDNTKGL